MHTYIYSFLDYFEFNFFFRVVKKFTYMETMGA